MLAFCIAQMFSLPAGNICMVLATIVFLLYVYKNGISMPKEYQGYFKVIAIFMLTMLTSAICSDKPGECIGFWANRWVWRSIGFFIILFMFDKEEFAQKLLFFALLGFVVDSSAVIYNGIQAIPKANNLFRPSGVFGNPMKFGGMACLWMPCLMVFCFEKDILTVSQRKIAYLFFTIGIIATVWNATRGAWVALLPICGAIIIYYTVDNLKKLLIVVLAASMLCGCLFTIPFVNQKLISITDTRNSSNLARGYIWQGATRMFIDYPILGVGYGRFQERYEKEYAIRRAARGLNHAHSNIFEFLGETGLVGLYSFLSLFGYIIFSNLKKFWLTKNPYALILGAGTLAFFIQGLTEYNFGQAGVAKNLWLFWGIMAVLTAKWKKD